MSTRNLKVGDIVKLSTQYGQGVTGIVSQPITEENIGHVLMIYTSGHIRGLDASLENVVLADEKSEGFAQLAYILIRLGSHVIEKRLL